LAAAHIGELHALSLPALLPEKPFLQSVRLPAHTPKLVELLFRMIPAVSKFSAFLH
jgi:hypothetical protein